MSVHANLFTSEEHVVLSSWLTATLAGEGCPETPVHKASTQLGITRASLYSPEAVAAATIVHDAIQQKTPPYRLTASVRRPDGSLEARQRRVGVGNRFHRMLSLLPHHLFTIYWPPSTSSIQTCAYHLIWLPLYEANLVTASYKATKISDCEEVAIGHFGPTNAAPERAAEVIAADWRWHRERGMAQLRSVFAAGLIGEREAKVLAAKVWSRDAGGCLAGANGQGVKGAPRVST